MKHHQQPRRFAVGEIVIWIDGLDFHRSRVVSAITDEDGVCRCYRVEVPDSWGWEEDKRRDGWAVYHTDVVAPNRAAMSEALMRWHQELSANAAFALREYTDAPTVSQGDPR